MVRLTIIFKRRMVCHVKTLKLAETEKWSPPNGNEISHGKVEWDQMNANYPQTFTQCQSWIV